MRSVVRNLLTLVVGVLLALPPGWCCILASAPVATTQKPAPSCDECCRGCCPQPPSGDEVPAGRPPMTLCCCDNLVSRHEGPVKDLPPDTTPGLTCQVEVEKPASQLVAATDVPYHSSCSLHILLCVWTC